MGLGVRGYYEGGVGEVGRVWGGGGGVGEGMGLEVEGEMVGRWREMLEGELVDEVEEVGEEERGCVSGLWEWLKGVVEGGGVGGGEGGGFGCEGGRLGGGWGVVGE